MGRTFNASGNSSANILASDESIITNFSFYLGRIDRIYLDKSGALSVRQGAPSETPQPPTSVDGSLELAVIELFPYMYSTSQVSLKYLEHKRYRMVDIKQLENRIKNLEYYTSLSLLETNTTNLFVPDSDGLNRFKSGFFVDNFTSFISQETEVEYQNSIDITNKELRSKHYTNSVDLISKLPNANPTSDLRFSEIDGIGVRKTGDIITLDYTEVVWLTQGYATRSESVTPFMISFWKGNVVLTPSSDTWMDTARLDAKIIDVEGNYSEQLLIAQTKYGTDPQTGFGPTIWDSWETNWT